MTEKKPQMLMNRAALQEFRNLKKENATLRQQSELLEQRVQYQNEIISALRDAIQTFQGRAHLQGALDKIDLDTLKAPKQ